MERGEQGGLHQEHHAQGRRRQRQGRDRTGS